jgi:hypothetical protein
MKFMMMQLHQIATTLSEEMNMTLSQVLIAFGEWWVVHTTSEKSRVNGVWRKSLSDFLINLPNFHRVMLVYPNLPPEFKVSDVSIWLFALSL